MQADSPNPATSLLLDWRRGRDPDAHERLMPLVYDELRRIARAHIRSAGHTLQPTALVHEAYARMVNLELEWQDRAHFLSMAARAMRRVLIDHARGKKRQKRGRGVVHLSLDAAADVTDKRRDLVELDDALNDLDTVDHRSSQALELHFFGGLSYEEIAETLAVSPATVGRDIRFAKAWIRRDLGEQSA